MKFAPAVGHLADLIRGHLADDARTAQPPSSDAVWGDEDERRAILDVPAHGVVTFPEQLTQALAWPAQDLVALTRAANTTFNVNGWIVGAAGAIVDMSRVYRCLAKLTVGGGTAGCTTVAAFFAGNTSNTLQAVTGAAWTWAQVSGAATMNVANSATPTICTAEIRADQLPANTRYLILVVNNQCSCQFSAEMICAGGAYRPTSQYNCTAILGQSVT